MRTQRHNSLAPAALRAWKDRGLSVTVSYYRVAAASGAAVNWSAGTAAATSTNEPVDGIWIDIPAEMQGIIGGGTVMLDGMFITAGPQLGAPSTRDYVVKDGKRYEVGDTAQPLGAGGLFLLQMKRTR